MAVAVGCTTKKDHAPFLDHSAPDDGSGSRNDASTSTAGSGATSSGRSDSAVALDGAAAGADAATTILDAGRDAGTTGLDAASVSEAGTVVDASSALDAAESLDGMIAPLDAALDAAADAALDAAADATVDAAGMLDAASDAAATDSGAIDVDECAAATPVCDPLTRCIDQTHGYDCTACPSGYSGDGKSGCSDIDECATHQDGCDPLAGCTNTPGGYTCGSCPAGYGGGGASPCVDIDECAAGNACDPLTQCTNDPGSFHCSPCPSGYGGTGKTSCVDVDECADSNACDALTQCTNDPGSYHCSACPSGYSGSGQTGCVNVDECTAGSPCDPLTQCTDLPGTFTCSPCPSGYSGTGATACIDSDECANSNACDALTQCTNDPGSYHCSACPSGYSGTGETGCVQLQVCGDGVVQAGEACDDGNTVTETCGYGAASCPVCDATCQLVAVSAHYCGDGVVELGLEGCDDGNANDLDACSNQCVPSTCGNSVLDSGEQCDDGNDADPLDGCKPGCIAPVCGDGVLDADPVVSASWVLLAGCMANGATLSINGVPQSTGAFPCPSCGPTTGGSATMRTVAVSPGDLPRLTQTAALRIDLSAGGTLYWAVLTVTRASGAHEDIVLYDAGNPGDAESRNAALCASEYGKPASVTGNVWFGERCDDGNSDDTDACTNACSEPLCGDGIVQATEECDDANVSSGDACVQCRNARCGDGFTRTSVEACDDGNTIDADGCTSCVRDVCGDGVLNQAGAETCDDGNTVSGDGCSSSCKVESCGDGVVAGAPNETCDDGNQVLESCPYGAPSCSVCGPTCQLEAGTTTQCSDGTIDAANGESCELAPGSWVQTTVGDQFSCGLQSSGSVACWGSNGVGQLNVPAGVYTQISSGSAHSCGLLVDKTIRCWGSATSNQLNAPTGTFTQVSAGGAHSCALQSDGSEVCWGNNTRGQANGQTGTFLQISAGGQHTCALRTDQTILCWGSNSQGQLNVPSGTFVQVAAGTTHTCAIRSNGTLACWGGTNLASPPSGTFTQLSAGNSNSCALGSNGKVRCWGCTTGSCFLAPVAAPQGYYTQVAVATIHQCSVRVNGYIACTGSLVSAIAAPENVPSCKYGETSCTGCDPTCQLVAGKTSFCGDGLMDSANGETCDDANTITEACNYGATSCTVCASSCQLTAGAVSYCGDGALDSAHEACDDGGTQAGDGCSGSCQLEFCGDGTVNNAGSEDCDDGNTATETCSYGDQGACVVCDATCHSVAGALTYCGDGAVDASAGESCDDGNTITEDCGGYGQPPCTVCDATCHLVPGAASWCGDGNVDPAHEACDEGAANGGLTALCASDCTVTACVAAGQHVIMQQSSYAYGEYMWNPTWQSFTPSESGYFTGGALWVQFYSQFTFGPITVELFDGEGTTGALLGSVTAPAPATWLPSAPLFFPFGFPAVPLLAGHHYTLRFAEVPGTMLAFAYDPNDPYPGGRSDRGASNDLGMYLTMSNVRSCTCGDGNVDANGARVIEQCDDGNVVSGDGCDANCVAEYCGDGVTNDSGNETCDDGNAVTEVCAYGQTGCTVCNASCQAASGATSYCGDGATDPTNGETCDDGNTITEVCDYGLQSCAVCDSACHTVSGALPYCGDGVVTGPEQCDEGAANGTAVALCSSDCRLAACLGTGQQGVIATSDDQYRGIYSVPAMFWQSFRPSASAYVSGVWLRINGSAYGTCYGLDLLDGEGDGGAVLATANTCIPGGLGWDGASTALPATPVLVGHAYTVRIRKLSGGFGVGFSYGDSYPSGTTSLNLWDADVTMQIQLQNVVPCDCGNGVLDPSINAQFADEECDDGNHTMGDGCSPSCAIEYCGDGVVNSSAELCDDGNNVNEACAYGQTSCGCDATCTGPSYVTTYCGDSVTDSANGEDCDDGNTADEECTYGTGACTICNATCHAAPQVARYCGDGLVQAGYEACDEGSANGQATSICGSDCQVSACVGSGDSVAIDIPASGTVALTTFSSRTQSFVVDDAAYLTNISPALTLTGTSCVLAAVHEDPSLAHPLAYSQQALCSFNGGTAGGFTFPNTPLVAGHTYILQLMVITGTVQVEVSQSDPYPAGGSDLGASNDVVMTVRTANLRSCACGNGNVDLSTSARYPDEQCDDANIAAGDGCDADCQVE